MIRCSPPKWMLPGVALFYAGMIIGVSFIAVPAKFLAESVNRAQALDVGRQTFFVFGWVETAAALTLVVLALFAPVRRRWIMPIIVLLIVAGQVLLLRPLLDRRVEIIVSGVDPGPSNLHNMYGVLELVKLVLLGTTVWFNRLNLSQQNFPAKP